MTQTNRRTRSTNPPSKNSPRKLEATRAKRTYTAKTADRHELYQLSVQAPETEVEFMTRTFRKLYGRKPLEMREDFCGTALFSGLRPYSLRKVRVMNSTSVSGAWTLSW